MRRGAPALACVWDRNVGFADARQPPLSLAGAVDGDVMLGTKPPDGQLRGDSGRSGTSIGRSRTSFRRAAASRAASADARAASAEDAACAAASRERVVGITVPALLGMTAQKFVAAIRTAAACLCLPVWLTRVTHQRGSTGGWVPTYLPAGHYPRGPLHVSTAGSRVRHTLRSRSAARGPYGAGR